MRLLFNSFLLLFITTSLLAQSNEESLRISELYDLLPSQNNLYGREVLIYDYKLKSKNSIKDSTLISRISILQPEYESSTFSYDTNGLEVIKYEVEDNKKKAIELYLLNNQNQAIEISIVNNDLEILSKTFYTYKNDKLISEEAYTGYAYLDEPRRLSLITYTYQGDKLLERSKKYSLNGTNWIQTWWSKYDEYGNEIVLEESEGDITITYNNEFKDGRIVKSVIQKPDEKISIKEIDYNSKGYPKSVFLYYKKKNKPIRLTRYFYR